MSSVNNNALPMLEVCAHVLQEKYFKKGETTTDEIFARVAKGLASKEKPEIMEKIEKTFFENIKNGAVGAGRIMSSGGTGIKATLMNCFVQPVGDSIRGYDEDGYPGIYTSLELAAETMRMGGGVGYDFSRIRPRGAWIKSTQSMASGPCSYMNVFDASCTTVESLGARRGAQIGVLRIDHPDIEEFILAKRQKGRWNNFNVSVSVTDEFMFAVENDLDWELVHKERPHFDLIPELQQKKYRGNWIYKTVKAKDLWDSIMQNTYDHAEPGILFMDTINKENNLYYCEIISATNPCVTADTWVQTINGPLQVKDLIGMPFTAMVHGLPFKTESEGFFKTGSKEVFKLETLEGYSVKLTGDHKVLVNSLDDLLKPTTIWKEAKNLAQGDKIVLNDHSGSEHWFGEGSNGQGYLLGYLLGNGTIKEDKAVLPVWFNPSDQSEINNKGPLSVMWALENSMEELSTRSDFQGFQKPIVRNNEETGERRLASTAVRDLALSVGMSHNNKELTPQIEKTSSDFHKGFLRGLFDAGGTVNFQSNDIRLSQSNENTIYAVQRMLARLGIKSKAFMNRREAGERLLPDGKGGSKLYFCKANHELHIRGIDLFSYHYLIGFSHFEKQEKLNGVLKAITPRERSMDATFTRLSAIGFEDVYDVTVASVHAFDANGLMVHNCAEQPLPEYGCCDLGPIILAFLVTNPFGFAGTPSFDFVKLASMTKILGRMLDNVLDVTHWPLEQQGNEAHDKRRIGIGYTGLGTTLAMMKLKYNSPEALFFAAKVANVMRDAAYEGSVELAIEKGPFPKFEASKYLKSKFILRLPEELRTKIHTHGIRNSHLLSIAPTGTISLAFGNNVSNGIEPPFSFTYTRKKREKDGSIKEYEVSDYAYRLYEKLGGDVNNLPDYFVTAMEISAEDHMKMLEVTQPFIDSSISKTVNIPADYPYTSFKDLYMSAYKAGLKGLATYRPNSTLGSVLSVKAEEPKKQTDEEKRKVLEKQVILKRPEGVLNATVEKINYHGFNGKGRFYLTIGYLPLEDEDGITIQRPIEFFLKNLDNDSNDQWGESAMRMLSLAARGGFLDRALLDMQKVVWDRGPVRLGSTHHVEGHRVPKFHKSEVAAVAFAIQESIKAYGNNQKTIVAKEQNVETVNSLISLNGKECKECGAHAVVKRDGCEFCENCGMLGSCG